MEFTVEELTDAVQKINSYVQAFQDEKVNRFSDLDNVQNQFMSFLKELEKNPDTAIEPFIKSTENESNAKSTLAQLKYYKRAEASLLLPFTVPLQKSELQTNKILNNLRKEAILLTEKLNAQVKEITDKEFARSLANPYEFDAKQVLLTDDELDRGLQQNAELTMIMSEKLGNVATILEGIKTGTAKKSVGLATKLAPELSAKLRTFGNTKLQKERTELEKKLIEGKVDTFGSTAQQRLDKTRTDVFFEGQNKLNTLMKNTDVSLNSIVQGDKFITEYKDKKGINLQPLNDKLFKDAPTVVMTLANSYLGTSQVNNKVTESEADLKILLKYIKKNENKEDYETLRQIITLKREQKYYFTKRIGLTKTNKFGGKRTRRRR